MCIGIFGHVSAEIVSELIFVRYYLESDTQRLIYTSFLWRLRGRRWRWWIRWIRWTLAILALLSLRFMPFRRRWSTPIATLVLWVLVFVWYFCFFGLGSTSPPFAFFRDSLRRVPCVNFLLVFVGPHEARASNSILRMDLFPLLSWPASRKLRGWRTGPQSDKSKLGIKFQYVTWLAKKLNQIS